MRGFFRSVGTFLLAAFWTGHAVAGEVSRPRVTNKAFVRVGAAFVPVKRALDRAYTRANVPFSRLHLGSPQGWRRVTGKSDFGLMDYAQWLSSMAGGATLAREGSAIRPMARAVVREEAEEVGLPIGTMIRTKVVIVGDPVEDYSFVLDGEMKRAMRMREMSVAEVREAMTHPALTVVERNHILNPRGIDYFGTEYRYTHSGKAVVYNPSEKCVETVLGRYYVRDPSMKEAWAEFVAFARSRFGLGSDVPPTALAR